MRERQSASTVLSRRGLLKGLGAAAGALAISPLALRLASGAPATAISLGVLLPTSSLYPRLAASLLDGLNLAFVGAGPAVQLLPVEYGTLPSAAVAAGRRLIVEHGVDLLIGVISQPAIAQLQPLLHARRVPLLVTTAGANLLRHEPDPYIFHNTLGAWQASHAAGAWAAATLGPRIVSIASFHESGYDTLGAFGAGVASGGGTIVARHVTHAPGTSSDLTAVLRAVGAARPDALYAAYSGEQAAAFLQAYAESGLAAHTPLLGSPFLVAAPAPAGLRVLSPLGWSARLDPAANLAFEARLAAVGRAPDPFVVLGYESGLLIEAARAAPTSLAAALPGATVSGPRGPLRIERDGHVTRAPLTMRSFSWRGGAPVEGEAIPLAYPSSAAIAAMAATPKTGWLTAYLCL